MIIQNDSKGKPLFSVGDINMLHMTKNGSGDICVTDHIGEAVIVVNANGKLRFEYHWNISRMLNSFKPSDIASYVIQPIIINDAGDIQDA